LAELLRTHGLHPVYHGEQISKAVKDLGQSYSLMVGDSRRIKNRLKALFRGRAISRAGSAVYDSEERKQWLGRLEGPAVRARASILWEELDCLERLDKLVNAENALLTSFIGLWALPDCGKDGGSDQPAWPCKLPRDTIHIV